MLLYDTDPKLVVPQTCNMCAQANDLYIDTNQHLLLTSVRLRGKPLSEGKIEE